MEKTFEELIKETPCVKNGLDDFFGERTVLNLIRKVREATIAECKDKIWDEYGIYRKAHEIQYEVENLPTDRIKT